MAVSVLQSRASALFKFGNSGKEMRNLFAMLTPSSRMEASFDAGLAA
jgi:hypothetical protein